MDVKLKQLVKDDFKQIFMDMEYQFPPEEMKSYNRFLELLNNDNYQLFSAQNESEKIGYVIVAIDEKTNCLWLDYIAVFKNYHSKGYGGEILPLLKNHFPNTNGCYLEVEKPDENKPDTLRRIRFYKKLGAVKIDCVYFYPNKENCLEMDLYFIPYKKDSFPDCNATKTTIESVFKLLHCEIKHLDNILKKIRL